MRIGIYSTMFGASWGGSEELWSRAAEVLLRDGHDVSVSFNRRGKQAPRLANLAGLGATIQFRRRPLIGRTVRRWMQSLPLARRLHSAWLAAAGPDLVLISMGSHVDDLSIAATCRALGVPYSLLLQAASPYQWLDRRDSDAHREVWTDAVRCYFVSEQNRDVVEANLAIDLSRAQIVDNPFSVPTDAAPPWPKQDDPWKLACVARLHFAAKGQDVLLQTLRRQKWRERPLEVSLWGADGGSRRHIDELIRLYGLERHVRVKGFTDNIEDLWSRHHALILPSRFEGNPLALIEAMMCGRTVIVTNVGRVAELVDDDRTGFIAAAASVDLVDDALERAWQRRHEWEALGQLAASSIRQRHSLHPAEDFAAELVTSIEHAKGEEIVRAA